MLKLILKKSFFAVLLRIITSTLILFSTTINAATISSVLTPNSNITVSDSGTDGITKISFTLTSSDTTGVWLLMDPSPTVQEEDFQITTVLEPGFTNTITDLHFQVVKLNATPFGSFIPTVEDWKESLLSPNPPSESPAVGNVTLGTSNTSSSYRFHMTLSPVLPTIANSTMILDLTADDPATTAPRFFDQDPWLNFNDNRSQFYLNIDWNTVDSNSPAGPSAATLVSPSGATTTTPTYTWNAVPDSSWYYLWVDDARGNVIKKWYTATEAGCAEGTGTCSITPSTTLVVGKGAWWIKTWGDLGNGPWSVGMAFNIGTGSAPAGVVSLVSPNGSTTNNPTYSWNAESDASWYQLWVTDSSSANPNDPVISQWYTAAQVGCADGTGTCSITHGTTLASGAGQWWVRTWNSDGYGSWSFATNITVN